MLGTQQVSRKREATSPPPPASPPLRLYTCLPRFSAPPASVWTVVTSRRGWERHLVNSGGMGPALTGSCACHFSAPSTCSADSQVILQDLSHRVGGNKGAVALPPPLSCPRTALPPSPWQPVAPSPAFTASPLACP